jgi:hypothetical protein
MKIVKIEHSCSEIDFTKKNCFSLNFDYAIKGQSFTFSLFNIDSDFLKSGSSYKIRSDTNKLIYVTVSGTPSYGYIMNNCVSYRPIRIDGFRLISADTSNLNNSITIHNKKVNGIYMIEPHSFMEDKNIFSPQSFIDVNLGNLLFLNGETFINITMNESTRMTMLFAYTPLVPNELNFCNLSK